MLEKTLEGPLDSKAIHPVNPKYLNPEYSLEGLMVKVKLQYSVKMELGLHSFGKIYINLIKYKVDKLG